MFNMGNRKHRTYLIILLVSLAILLFTFFATDGLSGDKDFSEYTQEDWAIAILPLSIIAVSGVSTVVFSLIIIIPMMLMHPALDDYVSKRKFADIDSDTEFLVFDHNEFKRACCRSVPQNGVWVAIKEYDLKKRSWTILEEGRYIDNADDVLPVLQKEYGYDEFKVFYPQN